MHSSRYSISRVAEYRMIIFNHTVYAVGIQKGARYTTRRPNRTYGLLRFYTVINRKCTGIYNIKMSGSVDICTIPR